MRKIFIVIGLMITGITINAQIFQGARFDINARQVNNDNGDKLTSDASFGFYDIFGYRLTDVWDIGAEFGGTVGVYKNHTSDDKTTSAHWLLSPFARYTVLQAGKFDFMAKGSLILEGTKNYFLVGVQVVPMVSYNMTEHIALHTNLNFLSFGISRNKTKNGNATTNFNLGGNSNNVATLGGITIGFVYKF